ncbi:Transcriptional activator CadC [Tsuneonella dongtanensis]|uniref:Transcriptional activator CadC n=1 Tax=Tsuneonella dongtanensis TaxID=692370 RepID=A0A1B2AFM9_9SPHN|nr:winged helix-turn-helix domain-containing protein [Tsuneonella dongtanensis]ANY20949.1 Transcriptional activator CadC [Tsuneonella dongtanensis]
MNESRFTPETFPLDRGEGGSGSSRLDPRSLAKRPDFALGAATVRPSVRTVEGPGGTATAEPRVMQVLVALVDARGAVLTRDDLIRHCWKGQVVGDDAINRAIGEVRRIARSTDGGFGVETIPRIGYRLSVGEADGADAKAAAATVENAPSRSVITRRAIIAGGLVAAAGGAGYWLTRPEPQDISARLIARSEAALHSGTPEGEARAIALLEKAVASNPAHAAAWGRLALTRARVDEHGILPATIPLTKVSEAADRALELDADNADALSARAVAVPYYGDWIGGERRLRSVLDRHPGHVETVDSYAFFLGAVGRMREGAELRQTIAETAPLDPNFQFRKVYTHWFMGQTEQADRTVTGGLKMWPRHNGLWFARLWLLAGTGRFDRALAHIGDAAGRPPLPPPMVATFATAVSAAQSRDADAIEAATAQVMGGVGRNVASVVSGLMLLNLMGANDPAFALAEAYYLEEGPILSAMDWRPGQPMVPDQRRRKTNMLFTPTAAGMQRDARFMPLMERIGLANYWRRSGATPDFLAASSV